MILKKQIAVGMMITSALLLSGCSHHFGRANGGAGLSSFGLGKWGRFAGQEAGESYTTQAPHEQIYLFSYDDSVVNAKYHPSIFAQAEYLKTHPKAQILLAGHTDERGSREYNIALGEHRAQAVAELIRQDGVSRHQIRIVSYGKERPVNEGHDPDSHKQNRRVELTYEMLK
ncbi:MAG: peptidoglycan-associated lipoprotein Pal [Legionella sp.]|nr:peptidoglycan-associated lipoprotein Pal [Legionella sp.]